jgi:hypothetical protein
LPLPHGVVPDQIGLVGSLGALAKSIPPILGGAVVAFLLGRRERPLGPVSRWKALDTAVGPVRRVGLALSAGVEGCDDVLRQWPMACISVLTLAALFAASMLIAS